MKLRMVVISALLLASMSIGLTSFISTGLTEYGVQNNVDTSNMQKLQKIENATSMTQKAKRRAANVESKSNYFNLPGVIKTAKLTFDAVGLWNVFINIIVKIVGLNHAPANWPVLFATGSLGVSVAYIFVKRFF
ncbi:MAG: hypothetical protein ABEK00_00195 [Candidatus Nanohaloarchaea archaeon]